MFSCAMLMPSRTRRSLMAHFIATIVARKSAMMRSVGSSSGAGPSSGEVARWAAAIGSILRVT